MAAPAGEQREQETPEAVDALTCRIGQGRHHGNIGFRQFTGETVFFVNLFGGPAVGAVELRDQRLAVLDAHLVNPVFVAVQGQQPGVA